MARLDGRARRRLPTALDSPGVAAAIRAPRITAIETIRLRGLPHALWVRVHAEGGLTGLGETWFVPGAAAAVIHDVAAPILLGQRAFDIERHWATLCRATECKSYGSAEMRAISSLDIALWDLLGQATGRPLYDLMGGLCRERIRIYNTCASPSYAFQVAPPSWTDGGAETARHVADEGAYLDYEAFHEQPEQLADSLIQMDVTAMKLWPFDRFAPETGGQYITPSQIAQGVELVKRIRSHVGDRIDIAIDLTGKWNLASAVRIAHALEPYHLLWLEDPLAADPVEDLERLARETTVPICAGERLVSRQAFRQLLERQAIHMVMLDIGWAGGITEARKIAALADAHQLPLTTHDCSGPVNLFAAAHLCASTPNVRIMETVRAFYRGFYADIVEPNLDIRDGQLYVPDRPGLGTALRPEVLARTDAIMHMSRWPEQLRVHAVPQSSTLLRAAPGRHSAR